MLRLKSLRRCRCRRGFSCKGPVLEATLLLPGCPGHSGPNKWSGETYGPAMMLLPRLEQGTADNVFKNMEMYRCIGFSPANWPLLQND